jgi:CheY-like chemotaxis protein
VEEAQPEHYAFAVEDTGPGIAPGQQEAIFAPFHQVNTHGGGTGLGLAIARRQVELMGGTLGVESREGRGARFFFALPLAPAQGQVGEEANGRLRQVVRLAAGQEVRLLIVDDVATNREILAQILARLGAQVQQAPSGEAALEAVRRQRPDLIFMDIRMPGMNGVEVMQALRREHGPLPMVAISASVLEHEREHYLQTGFDAFLDKPFRLEHIYACLEQVLGVQYEYAAPKEEVVVTVPVALPAELVQRCAEAARFYRVTELRACLEEVEGLGDGGRVLAQRLRERVQAYDMEGVMTLLKEAAPT